jgi:PPOX class probable F420-dependent enzyme
VIDLTSADRTLLASARTATLATLDPSGRPRLVPVCFILGPTDHQTERRPDVIWIPLDEKPKRSNDPRRLARVRDIAARPDVSILVDHWSEEWSELAWLRLGGRARLVEPADQALGIVEALRDKYPQYRDHDLAARPMIAVDLDRALRWDAGPVGAVT